MTQPTYSPFQHIEEMNRRLKLHSEYVHGMAFVPYPNDASVHSISGYSVTGPLELMGVYAQIAHEVSKLFNLKI
jgi:hypothetical protein